jgi:hypothetical protein
MIPAGESQPWEAGLWGASPGRARPPGNGALVAAIAELLWVLELEPVGEGRFRGQNFSDRPRGVVFGGQLLAQAIMAGATIDPSKEVKTIPTILPAAVPRTCHSTLRSKACIRVGLSQARR